MAVRRKKQRKPGEVTWIVQMVRGVRSPAGVFAGSVLTGLLCVAAVVVGLVQLDEWVAQKQVEAEYDTSVELVWADLPDWLQLPDNRHIIEQLWERTGLEHGDHWSDRELARRVAGNLTSPDVGWIDGDVRVIKQPPNRLVVDCKFRKPYARVRYGESDYLIDVVGVRLPNSYRPTTAASSGMREIVGISAGPPQPGRIWDAPELRGALAVLSMVSDASFAPQITGVSVANYGRPGGFDVVLLTECSEGSVNWGSVPGQEDATEIPAVRKIALLNLLFEETGRIYKQGARLDVTTWPDRIGIATDPRGSDDARFDVVSARD